MTVVAAIFTALLYTIAADIIFQRSAIYDPRKYAHPNDWFGLNFLFDIPLSLMFLVPLFIVIALRFRSNRRRGFGMACGIVLATLACCGFLGFYAPADRSLGDSASTILILCWGMSSVACAFLSQRLIAIERWSHM